MKKVVITGIGAVTPIGKGWQTVWNGLLAGTSGIGRVSAFDTSLLPVHLGAEVRDFEPGPLFRNLNPAHLGRASKLACAAAYMALEDAGLASEDLTPGRTGVSMGTTSGEPEFVEQYNDHRKLGGYDAIPAGFLPRYPSYMIPNNIATELGLQGPCVMLPTACAAGNFAIGYGFDAIRMGKADMMLCGGADAFSRITYTGFARLGAIAPERCQPFDRHRKGMVPGEGAAVLILESVEAAKRRGARVYAEVLGCGLSCDSHHMTAAHPQGDGAIRAMAASVSESGIGLEDVDYISAHGTGTPTNDRVESLAVQTLFEGRASGIPMSSVKSMLGHTMGAASAIEAGVCATALFTGWIPPTINFEQPEDGFDLDYVPNQARKTNPRIVLNNAYAFGGNNASLCLARHEG